MKEEYVVIAPNHMIYVMNFRRLLKEHEKSGADITAMMQGAADARKAFCETDINKNDCYKYAAIRNILYRKGKKIEVFETYESALQMTTEWWKQLYGESEGKDGKGILPDSVIAGSSPFSTPSGITGANPQSVSVAFRPLTMSVRTE